MNLNSVIISATCLFYVNMICCHIFNVQRHKLFSVIYDILIKNKMLHLFMNSDTYLYCKPSPPETDHWEIVKSVIILVKESNRFSNEWDNFMNYPNHVDGYHECNFSFKIFTCVYFCLFATELACQWSYNFAVRPGKIGG